MRPRIMHLSNTGPELAAVLSWRRRLLIRAGFSPALADALANERGMDVHALLELVARGCPPELAARVLAPLESGPEQRH